MLRVPLSNPHLKRTIRPLYANHQATPWGGFLDPDYDPATDGEILPGTPLTRVYGEVFAPATAGRIFALSALFVAPSLGVNEMTASGTNLFTGWTGGPDAVFEILAPAFDPAVAELNVGEPGSPAGAPVFLKGAKVGNKALLAPGGAVGSCIELIDVVSPTKIVVRINLPGTA